MLDILLFWANQGVDVLRLDAVAFLWKKIGTNCQNERNAHLILQLMKDCCQVAAPGVLFIAEAIVAPVEVIKYFGEDAIIAKECEIAYNATLMALLWDGIATKNAKFALSGREKSARQTGTGNLAQLCALPRRYRVLGSMTAMSGLSVYEPFAASKVSG